MAVVQQVRTPKSVEIDPPQTGNTVSALVRDLSSPIQATCSFVSHADASGVSVSWTKSNQQFPIIGAVGWQETWTPPAGATFQVESNGKVKIHFGGGRDPNIYDATVTELAP